MHSVQRVLMSADAVGGVWTYALELAQGLARFDIETVLAVMGPGPSDEQRAEARGIPRLHLVENEFHLEWMPEPWEDVERAGEWLLDLEQEWQPQIIHLNGYAHAQCSWQSPAIVVAHSCVETWWRAVHSQNAPPERRRYREEVQKGLNSADAVVAPTRAMLEGLQSCYGTLPLSHVIPNGRNPEQFRTGPKLPILFTAGRLWDPAKNMSVVERIADRLPWPVSAAGSREADSRSTSFTNGFMKETGSNLHLLGRLSGIEMREWLSLAEIYLAPARYEPFGLSILEAALSGCALVLGDIPSLRENWDGAALFHSPDDEDGLLRQVLDLIESKQMRWAMQERAQERGRQFTSDRMAEAYRELYASVIAQRVAA